MIYFAIDFEERLRYDIGTDMPLISPIGSLRSRIGLVFDKAGSATKDPHPSWATGMHEMGITKQNALMWPYNLCAPDTLLSHEESQSTFAKQSESFIVTTQSRQSRPSACGSKMLIRKAFIAQQISSRLSSSQERQG